MGESKNTCPVCFTKMKTQSDGLVCPECGYKYCDHAHKQDIYDTSHTHAPQYTTYQTPRTDSVPNTAAQNPVRPQPVTNDKSRGNRAGKIIRIVVIAYIIIIFLSVFGSFFTSALSHYLLRF